MICFVRHRVAESGTTVSRDSTCLVFLILYVWVHLILLESYFNNYKGHKNMCFENFSSYKKEICFGFLLASTEECENLR